MLQVHEILLNITSNGVYKIKNTNSTLFFILFTEIADLNSWWLTYEKLRFRFPNCVFGLPYPWFVECLGWLKVKDKSRQLTNFNLSI